MSNNINNLVGYKIALLAKMKRQLIDFHMKTMNLSRTQWQLLIRFNILSTPCTQKMLLQSLEIDRAHLTRTLDQLEKRRLVQRRPLENDRRSVNVSLTSQGKTLLKEATKVMYQESDILLDDFSTAEKELVDDLLKKMTTNVLVQLNEREEKY